MHDFIQHLSFNSSAPFTPARATPESLRALWRSLNEAPAPTFRPSPRRRDPKAKSQNRKSKILP